MGFNYSLQLGVSHPPFPTFVSFSPNAHTAKPTLCVSPFNTQTSQKPLTSQISPPSIPTSEKQWQTQTFVELVRDCAAHGSITEGKIIHGLLLKSGLGLESGYKKVVLINHLAYMYTKQSNLVYARRLFDMMPHKNVFSWTVMILGSTEHGLFLDGFKLFCEMLSYGVQPDKFAYTTVVQACLGLNSVEFGKMVHGHIVKSDFTSHVFVSTSLLNMYARFGKIEDSICLFGAMGEHNQVSWNALISGLMVNDHNLEAFDQYLLMKKEGFELNIYTFASVLKAIAKLGDVNKGKDVHQHVLEANMESNIVVGTALIDMYSKCKCVLEARLVFNKNFTKCNVNTPWNAMITGYSQNGYSEEAVELFYQMCINSVGPDHFTYGSVFNACASLNSLRIVREVHGRLVKFGEYMAGSIVNNALADGYSKSASIQDAEKVFTRMEERDVVSWTTMVTAYTQCSEGEKALNVFFVMREAGVKPNQFTFASVLVTCASLCLLEYGQQLHGLLCKFGFGDYDCIQSSLIDMYAKCGTIDEAEKVFKRTLNPDVVSWTAIISGNAQHGCIVRARQLFTEMEESEIQPNGVTILCVLFACSHGALVDEGLQYFYSMRERYGITPQMEHYACVVDLLGRVGRLDDAMDFINSMPIKPSEMVWQNLLGACRVHGNARLAELAAKKIFSVIPDYSATYVLLSNTYIEMGSLEDGVSVRKAMKERGVQKEPGFSWTVIGGRIHKFFSGDQRHPKKNEIYEKLEELTEKVQAMGYVLDLKGISL